MKSMLFGAWALMLGSCILSAFADEPLIYCQCNQGDYHRPGHYQYKVNATGFPMTSFSVGTNDPDPRNYENLSIPPGWHFAVEAVGLRYAFAHFSYHGDLSIGPDSLLTPARVHWWTDNPDHAIDSFVFAFDHPWIAEDVGWELRVMDRGSASEVLYVEEWQAPAGSGAGPVHGPQAPSTACVDNPECGDESYCAFLACQGATGICLPRPQFCPAVSLPVCACDGMTYPNVCFAALASVSVAYESSCKIGDFDLDGDVDLSDLAEILGAYHSCVGDPAYFSAADFDHNGCIELSDLATLLGNYRH